MVASYEDMFEQQRQLDEQKTAAKAAEAKAIADAKAIAGAAPASSATTPGERAAELFNKQNPIVPRKANRHSITVCTNASQSTGNSMRIQQRPTLAFSYSQPLPKTEEQLAQEATVVQGWLYKRSKLVSHEDYLRIFGHLTSLYP